MSKIIGMGSLEALVGHQVRPMQATSVLNPIVGEAVARRLANWLNSQAWMSIAIQGLLFYGLLFIRRGQQLIAPQVWAEEGLFVVGYLDFGIWDLLNPTNGYLVLFPKLICFLALQVSILNFPMIATLIAWGLTIAILLTISNAPLLLRGGFGLSLLALTVPSAPEVFGTALHSFWWLTLLLFALALWQPEHHSIFKLPILLVAGLSTPTIILCTPIFFLRALRYKGREWLLAAAAAVCSSVQIGVMLSTAHAKAATIASFESLKLIVEKFFGDYLVRNLDSSGDYPAVLGLALVWILMVLIYCQRKDMVVWSCAFLIVGCVAMCCVRVDISAIDSVRAAPRYFFLPYTVTSWLLLHSLLALQHRLASVVSIGCLSLSVANSIPVLAQTHQDLQWSKHIAAALEFETYQVPIQSDGHHGNTWTIEFRRSALQTRMEPE